MALALVLALSGCKSDGERLGAYLQSGGDYAEQGDYDRALVQFRNALKIDPDHAETRAAMGQVLLEQGALREAREEFVILSERFPDRLEFRSRLGQIALVSADWAALDRQAAAARAIDDTALDSRALDIAARYRAAVREKDAVAQDALAAEARALLAGRPDQPVLLRVAVDNLTKGPDPAAALPLLDAALDIDPHAPELQLLRIRLLADSDRLDAAEDRLLDLARLYPDDPQIAGLLVARHLSKGRIDAAENVLRALAEGAPAGETPMRMLLVRFLYRMRGAEAALAELARLIDGAGDAPAALLYSGMDRSIRFDEGDRDGAVQGLRALLADLDDASAEARALRVLLAGMQDRLGERQAARGEIAEVLALDPYDAQALKLRATWAIEADDPKSAIVDLRTALAQRPRDTELMTLLAAAHAQDGNRGLAMEQLSAAAQVSGHAARESERYADALLTDGRPAVARRVLEVAHTAAPGDVPVARALIARYIADRDWRGAERVLAGLGRIDTPTARSAAEPLRAALLLGQGRDADAARAMQDMLAADPGRQAAFADLVAGFRQRGEMVTARSQIEAALALYPDDAALGILAAEQSLAEGDFDRAEREYRALARGPGDAAALRLFALLAGQGRRDAAEAVLRQGLTDHPTSRGLRLIEANRREVTGDVPGAIELLEALHADRPGDPTVANNLASLLVGHDDDPATLARAARIVAPLRGTANPAVSDTIGWIAFRRGDAEGALPLMRRAARGLPDDALVRSRLGQVQAALGRSEEARAAFAATLDLAPADHPIARDALRRLSALGG
ncbi:tetratricopeptide repeat protein [Jannaschia sp. S6380]|uniref:tetratricopeptide repeat protein n=1 Tax=Jannaschia sp. S6380 TaxID=2926408 RepID=UPI001FF690F2|nr:tetratricopeptide repeat protein [Jannaschia sp. S6380]MCK0168704.1 tetratricopeptide repeat protein [Jannaschia sp. S6380]